LTPDYNFNNNPYTKCLFPLRVYRFRFNNHTLLKSDPDLEYMTALFDLGYEFGANG